MSDEAMRIERARAGDAEAFAEIYDRYQPPVFRYIFYRVGDEHVAEDLTAEVFLRMVEKIRHFSYRGQPLLAWLYTIARNLVADHHRQKRQPLALPLDENLPTSAACPEEATERRVTQQDLATAIVELTEEQRMVILLKFVEGLDNETVAGLMGKPVGAVKSLQHRALAALRRILERQKEQEECR
jgi:RNA polymerase sigma-70 factor (ECF subfamily)